MNAARTPDRSRIVVALDPQRPTPDALLAAAAIASDVAGEIQGVFVENATLLRLAGHPIARELAIRAGATGLRTPEPLALEWQLRRCAEEVSRVFGQAARRLRRRCTFQVRQGLVLAELAQAALDAELLAIGLARRDPARSWFGADPVRLLDSALRRIAFVPEGATLDDGTLLCLDRGPGGELAAGVAAEIAQRTALQLRAFGETVPVHLAASPGLGASGRRGSAAGDLLDPLVLAATARAAAARMIVLPAAAPGLTADVLRRLLARVSCTVLVVR
jgi:hypothetical protein